MACRPSYSNYVDKNRSTKDIQIMYDRDMMLYEQTQMMEQALKQQQQQRSESQNSSSSTNSYNYNPVHYPAYRPEIHYDYKVSKDEDKKYDRTSDEFKQYLKLEDEFKKLNCKFEFNNEKIIWLIFLQFIFVACFLYTLISDIPNWLTIFIISNLITALSIAYTVTTNRRITLRLPEIETEQQILLDKAEQLKEDKQKVERRTRIQSNHDIIHNIHREKTVLKLRREV